MLNPSKSVGCVIDFFGISFRFFRQFNIVFRCLMKRQCVWHCKF
ncbi:MULTISPECIES: DUF3709 domain-containing protein [Gammaproteobacteria]